MIDASPKIERRKAPLPPTKIQVNSVRKKFETKEADSKSDISGSPDEGSEKTRRDGSVGSIKKHRAPEIPTSAGCLYA